MFFYIYACANLKVGSMSTQVENQTIIKDFKAILVIFVSFGLPQTIGGAFIRGRKVKCWKKKSIDQITNFMA